MFKEGAIVLTIQGKVKQKVIKQMTTDYSLRDSQGWFFVDYAIKEIPLHSKFDVLLEGASRKLVSGPGLFSIKLLTCLDQFGNKLSSVPEGFKTICKIESHPQMPTNLRKIPFLDGWQYNPTAVSLVKHEDIELNSPDALLYDLYKAIFIQLKTTFPYNSKRPLYRKDLVDFLQKSFKTQPRNANQILHSLMQMGKVTQKSGNELELAEMD